MNATADRDRKRDLLLIAAVVTVWGNRRIDPTEGPICIEVSRVVAQAFNMLGINAEVMTCTAYFANAEGHEDMVETPDYENPVYRPNAVTIAVGAEGAEPSDPEKWVGGSWDGHAVVVVPEHELLCDFDTSKHARDHLPLPPVMLGRYLVRDNGSRALGLTNDDGIVAVWQETPGREIPECSAATSDVSGLAAQLAEEALLAVDRIVDKKKLMPAS